MGLKISSIGSYKPKVYVSNEIWKEKFAPKDKTGDNEFVRKATAGVCERYYAAPDETVVSMATHAIEDCLSKTDVSRENIDLIIHNSMLSDHISGDAILIQQQTGIDNAFSYETTDLGCAGSMIAFLQASALMEAGIYQNILVSCVANLASRGGNMADLLSSGMGDLATAVLFSKCEEQRGFTHFSYRTYSELNDIWQFIPVKQGVMAWPDSQQNRYWTDIFHHIPPDCISGFKKSLFEYSPVLVKEMLEKADLDIQWLITHQPGGLLKKWRDLFGFDEERHLHTFPKIANCAMSNIPYTMMKAMEQNTFSAGDNILLVGIGVGVHIVAAILKW